VKADIHSPPATPKRTRETEKIIIKNKNPQQSQNMEDLIEVIEENVPIEEQSMEISEETENIEINRNLLAYREPKTPDDETSSGEETDKIFSPPAYKAKTKPLVLKDQKEQKTKSPIRIKIKQEKTPLNKKSWKQTPERRDKIPQKTPTSPRIKDIQDVPVNIMNSRDHIWMKSDHIVHFIDTRGNTVDEIGEELISRKIYKKPENF